MIISHFIFCFILTISADSVIGYCNATDTGQYVRLFSYVWAFF